MSVEEIIEKKGAEVEKRTVGNIASLVDRARDEIKRYVEELKEASKIKLPINLLEILIKGGVVKVKEFTLDSDRYSFAIYFDEGNINASLNTPISKGKYRAILIVEKLGE
jgi:hypothetical protein